MIDNNRWKHPLARSVSRMVWAFAPDDDRRDEVRLMADQVNRLEEELEVLRAELKVFQALRKEAE